MNIEYWNQEKEPGKKNELIINTPFHNTAECSQRIDVSKESWRSRTCGITSIRMLISTLKKGSPIPSLDDFIKLGIDNNAYIDGVGWRHDGLESIANLFDLEGQNYDWSAEKTEVAFSKMLTLLDKDPLAASIHLDFDLKKGGHIIVVKGSDSDFIYYNDPDSLQHQEIDRKVDIETFKKGWTKRIITITKKHDN